MALGREKGEAERGLAWFRGRIVARGFQSVKRRCAKTTWAEFPTGRLSSNGFNVASPLSRHFFLIRLTCKNSPPFPGQLLSNSDGFFLDFRESVESRQIFVCLKAALGNDDAICFISAVLIGCQRQPLVCECVSVCVSVCVCV